MAEFADRIFAFSKRADKNNAQVFKRAVKRMADDSQIPVAQGGRMPIDTGFLQDSITIGTLSNLTTGKSLYANTILTAPDNTAISLSYDAPYAVHVEFGNNGTPPRAFLRGAVMQFPKFLAEEARI